MCLHWRLGFSHVTQAGLKPSYVAEEGHVLILLPLSPSVQIWGMLSLIPAVFPFLWWCAWSFFFLNRVSCYSPSKPGACCTVTWALTRWLSCLSHLSAGITDVHPQRWLRCLCWGAERTKRNKKTVKKHGNGNMSFLNLKFQSEWIWGPNTSPPHQFANLGISMGKLLF